MMTPQQQQLQQQQQQQHQQQHQQNNQGQVRDLAPPQVRHQVLTPTYTTSFSEHRSPNNHPQQPSHISQQHHQAPEQRQQRSYREPPKSATFPPRRDWPGREFERGSAGERAQYPQPPKTATFPPPQLQHPPPTPSQRTHDKLDRLTAEASSYVQQISTSPSSALTSAEGAGSGNPTHRQSAVARVSSEGSLKSHVGQQQQHPQQRLHQLVTVQELNNSHSEPQSASSPSSATSMSSAHFARNLPRTSSIDSTLSNSSNHNHMHSHSSASIPAASPQEVASLISTAGSPEAVIVALLKDKASAQAQNTQLWRLVDKQRAMILGLNKDLERALKDKERYRKKAKEAMFPHGDHRENTESPAPSEPAEGHSPHDPQTPELARHGDTLTLLGHRERNDSVDSTLVQAPMSPADESTNQDRRGRTPSPSAAAARPPAVAANNHSIDQRLREPEHSAPLKSPRREVGHQDNSTPPRRGMPPLNVDTARSKNGGVLEDGVTPISPTPLSPERTMTPRKKAPPARLELSPTEKMPFKISRGSDRESNYDDDDDDNVSVEEISGYEQRMREKELKEMRTEQSGGSPTIKEDAPRKESSTVPDIKTIPAPEPVAQKHLTGSRPAPLQLSKLREAESVGMSPMFPPSERETIVTQRVTVSRPMSPGLPSSPRPSPNSPLPRPRRSMASPEPLSPRTLSPRMGLPSPRVGLMPGPFNPHGSPQTPSQATFASVGLGLVPLSPNPFTQEWPRKDSVSASSPVPELLIEPSAINTIEPRVVSSRMRPSRASYMPGSQRPAGSDSVFTLGVFSKATGKELWRVEKDVGALPSLDARLKHRDFTSKLPDRNLFAGHAPARVDARRVAIEEFFASVMSAPIDEKTAQALAEFFSADVVESPITPDSQIARDDRNSPEGSSSPRQTKEGYLTKRGKNFGGWKARYFILDGPILRYFEAPGGAHLGSIKLANAQIGRQSQPKETPKDGDQDVEAENQFRHAFLIMEPKRKDSGSLVRHVLCAESDAERDEWVDALMKWVEKRSEDKPNKAESTHSTGKDGKKKSREKERKDTRDREEEDLRAVSYEDVTAGAAPVSVPDEPRYRSPTPTSATSTSSSTLLPAPTQAPPSSSTPIPDRGPPSKMISGPTNGSVISDASMWGNFTDKAHKEAKAIKKRSIWGFRGRSSSDLTGESKADHHNRVPMGRMVFGVSLEEAIAVSRPFGVTTPLPAVVYRCLEYLDAKNAINEEGIFRLSGSNVVIKGLRDKFNSESDVNLLATDEYYDVHAVAGLLKLYLRELPTNILTTERREDFLRVTEMDDKQKKIQALNDLVHSLPIANFTLLKALSGHLIGIVDNAGVNKMNVRNVGIVFSPTLNIPAQVFALFLQEHHGIFFRDENEDMMDRPISPEQQRSPEPARRQKPRQLSISNERAQQTNLEPPKSAALPMSPGLKPTYDAPHYERPYPPYDESPRQQSPEGTTYLQQPNGLQLKMQESLQGQIQQTGQGVVVQVGRDSIDSNPGAGGMLEVKSQKARRRESSMLSVMGMGVRKSMLPPRTPQGTAGMVSEDNLYD
ncbi:hypothetical protein DFH27DRAFT_180762 [Peziza echinospora]|nr:hypothetical protein DFH27DRAFT_180762 [Peziza echinospora]